MSTVNKDKLEQLEAVMAEAAEKAIQGLGEFTDEQIAMLESREIVMDAEYPPNQFLFSVDGVPVITRADLHTIGGKQKGGKTSFETILIAACLCGQWERIKCLVDDMTILYIDTEMKQIDTQQLAFKAAQMAGVDPMSVADRFHLVNFRPLSQEEMLTGTRYYINKYKPQVVFIDGIVDLCSNFNDEEASQKFVRDFLMKTADDFNCAIFSTLHTNKTDGYSELRGHLGAYCEQKGSTVIKCEKDDDTNIVTVKFPTHRYASVPDIHFTYDENGLPISADTQFKEIEAEKQRAKKEQKEAEQQKVYANRTQVIIGILKANGGKMSRKQLIAEAMEHLKKSNSTVSDILLKMKTEANPKIVEANSEIALNES